MAFLRSLSFADVKYDPCLLDSDCLLGIVAEGWRRDRVLGAPRHAGRFLLWHFHIYQRSRLGNHCLDDSALSSRKSMMVPTRA